MSIDSLAGILFILLLGFFLWFKRKHVEVQKFLFPLLYVIMYRSKIGLRSMDFLASRFPKIIKFLGISGIVVGFVGMVLIVFELVVNTFSLFFVKGAVPGIQPVLPFEAHGVFFVPFLYWVISIFILAVVHEFAHGVVSRVYDIKVKSSGFAFLSVFLPIVPAAFVEPDEAVMGKRRLREQLAVFGAGPFANFLCALVVFGLFFGFSSIVESAFVSSGVEVSVVPDGPAAIAGLSDGDVIVGLNNVSILSVSNISSVLKSSVPGDNVSVETLNGSFFVTIGANPSDVNKSYFGAQLKPFVVPDESFVESYGSLLPPIIKWIGGLLFWLFMLNIGIGLFNLLPAGPLDGGRMFRAVCDKYLRKNIASRVCGFVSLFLLAVILVNMFAGFIL